MQKFYRREFYRRARGSRFGVGLVLTIASVALAASQLTAQAATTTSATTAGFVPARSGDVKPDGTCAPGGCGSGNLVYHGGHVMTTNEVYTIFWLPSGQTVDTNYIADINRYFQDVAHDSGLGSNVYAVTTQYSSIQYNSTFGGTVTDTTAFPPNGCPPYGGASICLTDLQLRTEMNAVISSQGWTKNGTSMFFMFTPKNVESCDPRNGCSFQTWCAYHGGNGQTIYANMPYAASTLYPGNCDVGQYPNSDDADATINLISHEHNEAITDPRLNAWYDGAGLEIADKCVWTFGPRSGSSPHQYNQTINGHHYFLQEEFSNANSRCVQTYNVARAPAITIFAPASGVPGTPVTISGSGFTGAKRVMLASTDATYTVVDNNTITATVPGVATGSYKWTVRTPAGIAKSPTKFTVLSP
jgi:hypothetical protein